MNITAVCLTLLVSAPADLSAPSAEQQNSAKQWREQHDAPASTPEDLRQTLEYWRQWTNVSRSHRSLNLGLEIKAISPARESVVHSWHNGDVLRHLSAANLQNFKEQLSRREPLIREPSREEQRQAAEFSARFSFHYLRPYRGERVTNIPLASPAELRKLKLNGDLSFYSDLVNDSRSVDFQIVGTSVKVGPLALNTQMSQGALGLDPDFAAENGFMLPRFDKALDLLVFFAVWEPAALEQVLADNRNSLPRHVDSVPKMMKFLTAKNIETIFPRHSAATSLKALRERLSHFILTEADGRELLRWGFERFLLQAATEDHQYYLHLLRELQMGPGPQRIFAKEFLATSTLPEFSLRIPVSVPANEFTVLRIEHVADYPYPDYQRKPKTITSP